MKGVTIEPTGNSKKSEPQMGFEHTTLRDLVRMLDSITEGRGFESHLGLGFFRVPSGFNCNTFHLICVKTFSHRSCFISALNLAYSASWSPEASSLFS